MVVKELLQFFVGKVDTKLFKAIELKQTTYTVRQLGKMIRYLFSKVESLIYKGGTEKLLHIRYIIHTFAF